MLYDVTWDSICDLARLYADERVAGFLSNAEVSTLVNSKAQLVIERAINRGHNGFSLASDELSWDSGNAYVTVASLFSQSSGPGVKSFRIKWSDTDWETVSPIQEGDVARYKAIPWGRRTPKGLIYGSVAGIGAALFLYPTPTENVIFVIHYVPDLRDSITYGGGVSLIGCPPGFREVVALETAVAIRAMQDEDTRGLESQLSRAYPAFDSACGNELIDSPMQVRDVYPEHRQDNEFWLPRA